MKLPLAEIFKKGDCKDTSQNLNLGERIYDAKQIILCGLDFDNSEEWGIFALILQTSAMTSHPHEVRCTIKKNNLCVEKCTCSCKAGASEICKHVMATLIFCNRNDIEELEPISSTDQKCAWKELTESALEDYKPEPIMNFHCFAKKKLNVESLSEMELLELRMAFAQVAPASNLAKNIQGRNTALVESSLVSKEIREQFHIILRQADANAIMDQIADIDVGDIGSCCRHFYVQNVVCLSSYEICENTFLSRGTWMEERKFRITGSRCYGLFTYAKDDWAKKSKSYFDAKKQSTKAMTHGRLNEGLARETYSNHLNCQVIETGLIVPEINPWLGYSPDGIIIDADGTRKLLEIKCPYEGRLKNIWDVIPQLRYLENVNGLYIMKKKHAYYAQIMMGMAVLNLKKCHFVLFATHDRSIYVIELGIDEVFVLNMLKTLKHRYFQKMLHNTCDVYSF